MNKRAILYLRFSDNSQVGGTSIATQQQVCTNACLTEGFEISEVVKNEAVSANKSNTQRVAELLNFCKERQGKFEVLMVYKLDRFARGQEQHHWLRGQLLKLGIILRSATERIDESPSGRLVEGVLAAVNEYDNEIKKERIKLAMWMRVEQGLFPWNPTIGYKSNPTEGKKLTPHIFDECTAYVVNDIFNKYSSGTITKTEIAKDLSKKVIHNSKGKRIKFSKQTIQNILNNVYYIGLLKHKDGRFIKGLHEPLIETSLYEKCQNIQNGLSNHATQKRLFNNPDFPLRRFIICSVCNKPFTGCWTKGKSGKKFAYYYCVNKSCDKYALMIGREVIHNEFYTYLKSIKPKQEFIEVFKKIFLLKYKERQKEIKSDYIEKLGFVKQLEQEQEWFIERAKKGIIPDNMLQKKLQSLEEEITFAKLNLTENHNEELEIDALLNEALVFIQTPELAWESSEFEAKLKYQRLIFPEGVKYRFNGYSNTKLGIIFELIKSFSNNIADYQSKDVHPEGFEPPTP